MLFCFEPKEDLLSKPPHFLASNNSNKTSFEPRLQSLVYFFFIFVLFLIRKFDHKISFEKCVVFCSSSMCCLFIYSFLSLFHTIILTLFLSSLCIKYRGVESILMRPCTLTICVQISQV